MTVEFKREGLTLEITAAQAYTKDQVYDLGNGLYGVAVNTYASGDAAVFRITGVYELPMAAAASAVIGAPAYWDAASVEVTDDPLFPAIGRFRETTGALLAQVDLNDLGGAPVAIASIDDTGTPYTLGALSRDVFLDIDTSGGVVTLNLPAAASVKGRRVTVKRAGSGVNAITIDPNGAETIEGAATLATLDAEFDVVTIVSNGVAWLIESSLIA